MNRHDTAVLLAAARVIEMDAYVLVNKRSVNRCVPPLFRDREDRNEYRKLHRLVIRLRTMTLGDL